MFWWETAGAAQSSARYLCCVRHQRITDFAAQPPSTLSSHSRWTRIAALLLVSLVSMEWRLEREDADRARISRAIGRSRACLEMHVALT